MRVFVPSLASLALLGVGLWFLIGHLANDLINWARFRDAVETPIVEVKSLETKEKRVGKYDSTLVLDVRFSYKTPAGILESGNISIHRTRDDFDRFRTKLYRQLTSGNSRNCFYLPSSPSSAALDRSLRPPTVALCGLFATIPLILGIIMLRAAIYEVRSNDG